MLRKTLTTLSLIGLLLSVGLWGASYWDVFWLSKDRRLVLFLWRSSLVIAQYPPTVPVRHLDPGFEVRAYVGFSRTQFKGACSGGGPGSRRP